MEGGLESANLLRQMPHFEGWWRGVFMPEERKSFIPREDMVVWGVGNDTEEELVKGIE